MNDPIATGDTRLAIARALHAADVEALSPRVTVEEPPLPDQWDDLHPDDEALYLKAADTALAVMEAHRG